MDPEVIVGILTVLLTVLTLLVSVLGGYLAYLARTVESRIDSRLTGKLDKASSAMERLFRSQLALVDVAVCLAVESLVVDDADSGSSLLYFLRQAIRLSSGVSDEIEVALTALEAAGSSAVPLYPYIERIRSASNWPAALEHRFEEMMKRAIVPK